MKTSLCVVAMFLSVSGLTHSALASSVKDAREHGAAMLRDAEDMVMHGGMGDAKAIVHHCREVKQHAEAIIKALPPADQHGQDALPHLRDAITYCERVAKMGDDVDPGATLNPATKARAAAREAMKHVTAVKDGGA